MFSAAVRGQPSTSDIPSSIWVVLQGSLFRFLIVRMPYYFGNLERDREQRPTSRLMRRVFDITDELQDNSQEDDNKNNSDGNDEELVVKMVHREVEKQLRISPDDTKENIIAKVGDVGADTALMTCVSSYTLQSGAVLCAQDNTPCTVCNMVHVNMRMQKLRNSRQQQAAYKRISAQLKPLHPPIESTECWFLFEILGRIAPSVSPYLEGHTL